MKYTSENLRGLQKIELEILTEIVRICENAGLHYFTVGGTTLGSIRHSDFIPWDDDVDIGFLRNDYERFIEIAPLQLRSDFYLLHYSVESQTPTYHAKVMKRNTLFVEEYSKHLDFEQGIFVDIMPFDRIPKDDALLARYRRETHLWHQVFIAKTITKTSMPKTLFRKIVGTVIRSIVHVFLLPIPKQKIYEKLQKVMTKYNDKNTEKVSSRGLAIFECNDSDIFPTIDHKFGSMIVQVPRNYDKILRQQYGDYRKLPPEEKRGGHAPYQIKY